jgi:cysteinyl-tRNA synthetase
VSKTNVYINSQGKNLNVAVVENVARWVGRMLRVFGLGEGDNSEIGWGREGHVDGAVNVCLRHSIMLSLILHM